MNEEDEKWNNARLKRLAILIGTWKNFLTNNDHLDGEEFKKEWLKVRELALANN